MKKERKKSLSNKGIITTTQVNKLPKISNKIYLHNKYIRNDKELL